MIEKLRIAEHSEIDDLSFRWRGMSISLEMTAESDGNKCLRLRVGGVGAAVRITDSPTENWTISILAESMLGVGVLSQSAASICVGPALNVTESGTTESHK